VIGIDLTSARAAFMDHGCPRVIPRNDAADGEADVRVDTPIRSTTAIAYHSLQRLKASAEADLAETVAEAVVAVPSCFGYAQREAIRAGGLVAGLTIPRFIGVATAAALVLGLETQTRGGRLVAVFAAGADFFDVAVVEMSDGLFQVEAVAAGGGLGPSDPGRGFSAWTDDSLARAVEGWRRCMADASRKRTSSGLLELRPEHIDELLLIGGRCREPRVRQTARDLLGRVPKRQAHEGVVAMGAAIEAGIIHGEVKDCVLLDVTPHTFGIETRDGTFAPIVGRNSTIPTRMSRVFSPAALDLTLPEVHVLEGEGRTAAENASLGRFALAGGTPASPLADTVEVTLEIDGNGRLSVSASRHAQGHDAGPARPE
jgi:molecular chaperone DnaK (HSP70)